VQINDLHKFQAWNPWAKIDPASKITYTGPVSGVDAAYHWVGNAEVGEGSMTIIESKPGELVRARMDFLKPFAASYTAEFTLKPEADKTTVTWSLFGENDFMSKAVKLVMNVDKMCGDQFEKGLASLSEIAALPAECDFIARRIDEASKVKARNLGDMPFLGILDGTSCGAKGVKFPLGTSLQSGVLRSMRSAGC